MGLFIRCFPLLLLLGGVNEREVDSDVTSRNVLCLLSKQEESDANSWDGSVFETCFLAKVAEPESPRVCLSHSMLVVFPMYSGRDASRRMAC